MSNYKYVYKLTVGHTAYNEHNKKPQLSQRNRATVCSYSEMLSWLKDTEQTSLCYT